MTDFKIRNIVLYSLRSQLKRLPMNFNQLALTGINRIFQFKSSRSQCCIIKFHPDRNISRLFRYVLLSYVYTRRGTVVYYNIAGFSHYQPYGTVNSTIDAKKSMIDRNHIRTCCIIGLDNNFILFSQPDLRTNFADKCRISSFMCSNQITVDINFGTCSYTLKA